MKEQVRFKTQCLVTNAIKSMALAPLQDAPASDPADCTLCTTLISARFSNPKHRHDWAGLAHRLLPAKRKIQFCVRSEFSQPASMPKLLESDQILSLTLNNVESG